MSDILLLRDNESHLLVVCDRGSERTLGSILTFCDQVFEHKISVEFVNERIQLNHFKMVV